MDGFWCDGVGFEGSPGSPDRRAPASGRPSPAQFGVWFLFFLFGVWGLGFEVWGLGLEVWGLGFGV